MCFVDILIQNRHIVGVLVKRRETRGNEERGGQFISPADKTPLVVFLGHLTVTVQVLCALCDKLFKLIPSPRAVENVLIRIFESEFVEDLLVEYKAVDRVDVTGIVAGHDVDLIAEAEILRDVLVPPLFLKVDIREGVPVHKILFENHLGHTGVLNVRESMIGRVVCFDERTELSRCLPLTSAGRVIAALNDVERNTEAIFNFEIVVVNGVVYDVGSLLLGIHGLTGRTDQNAEGLSVKLYIGGNVRAVVAFKRIGILGLIDVFFALLFIIVSSRRLFVLLTRGEKCRSGKGCRQKNGKSKFCFHKVLLFVFRRRTAPLFMYNVHYTQICPKKQELFGQISE